MSLGFASPALLWGLLAAALPLAIHLLLRRRPRPVDFPAIAFVLRAQRRTERRRRLRQLLLLAARTLLLAAVALAIARPRAERPGAAAASGPAATIIVLDVSGSMGYRIGGESLLDRARRDAAAALAHLPGEDPVAAMVCDGRPPAAPLPGYDRVAAARTIDEARPTDAHADLTSCLAEAARALGAARGQERFAKRIVVVTDLTAAAWRLDAPPPAVPGPAGPVRPRVEVVDAARGAPLPNLAVTGLEAVPDSAAGPRGYRVVATVAATGTAAAREVPLVLRAGEDPRPLIRALVDLPAGGVARKELTYAFPAGGPGSLTVALPPDALAVDDRRTVTVAVPREVRALVVDGAPSPDRFADAAWFAGAALASPSSPVRPTLVDGGALATADLGAYDVILLVDVRSVGARAGDLRRFVEAGGGLLVSMGDEVDPELADRELGPLLPLPLHLVKTAGGGAGGAALTGGGGAARLARVDEANPALAVFAGEAREGLLGARFERYMLAGAGGAAGAGAGEVLATFDDGAPALAAARRGRGRVLLYTSTLDRSWTDWPIRTSYLPALQRLTLWLAGALEAPRNAPTVVGAPRTLELGAGERLAALVDPDGRRRERAELERDGLRAEPASAGAGERVTFTPGQPGLWRVAIDGGGPGARIDPALAFAVVPDPRESDTRRLDPAELTAWLGGAGSARVQGHGAAATRAVPLWSILLVAATLLFLAEGALLGARPAAPPQPAVQPRAR